MRIIIVGAGNVGFQFATHCGEKGHSAIVYTKKRVGPFSTVSKTDFRNA